MIAALRVRSLKKEALNLVCCIQGIAMLFVELGGELFEDTANVGAVRCPAFVDHIAEDQYLAGPKDIGRHPVEGFPVDSQAQIAFTLSSKAADGRTIKGEIVPTLDEELFVI